MEEEEDKRGEEEGEKGGRGEGGEVGGEGRRRGRVSGPSSSRFCSHRRSGFPQKTANFLNSLF